MTKTMLRKSTCIILVLSLLLTIVSVFALSVEAASTSKKIPSGGSVVYFSGRTGSGWQYSTGVKKTTVTIKNTGGKNVTVYANGTRFLNPGQSYSFTIKGSNKSFSYRVQKTAGQSRGDTYVSVTTSAGSVW